jgi:uncharacterized protein (DUF1330 family)
VSTTRPYSVDRDSVVVLFKGGRLPAWQDVPPTDRDRYEQEHVDLMLAVGREHGLMGIEGFRLITAQGPWQRYWVIEFPALDGAEAWIDAEMRPPYGAYGFYEYELARRHAREELSSWPSRPRPEVVPLAADPHQRATLSVRTDSIVILLFGRWRPEAEMVPADVRGDDDHVELMRAVARTRGLMRIDAYRLLAPKSDYHRAWVIEFPTLADAEAWLEAEVLPPHGRYSDKRYLLARPWAPEYFATWPATPR